ncbi:hypothetical protein [Oceanobacillus indicireducens]|uniref:hypothetical protein n=1 Tax=Oceanobacillus indicireducens TaxID=1004261 RepID=UPI001664F39A|nr:hypothetical protein [Oceanobacillus indicireducens]
MTDIKILYLVPPSEPPNEPPTPPGLEERPLPALRAEPTASSFFQSMPRPYLLFCMNTLITVHIWDIVFKIPYKQLPLT